MINKTIICGIIAGILTYTLLYYRAQKDKNNKQNFNDFFITKFL